LPSLPKKRERQEIFKPKRNARVKIAHDKTSRGIDYYVLNNPDAGTYLEIDAQNYFLWELMDGEHTPSDIALAYDGKFGSFPFERLNQLIVELKANYLLEGEPIGTAGSATKETSGLLRRLAQNAFQKEFDWKRADEFYGALYRCGGRLLFTRPALILLAVIATVGLPCFIYLEPTETFQLFSIGGSYGAGLASLVVANLFMIFCHESGHALTCKRYGRRVRKAGFMFYMGMAAFFVDTTDMWMEKRSPRIAVSLAGPIVNVVLAGFISIVVMILPASTVTQSLFQLTYLGYLTALFNLNPLIELDGYYVLMDLLEIPHLRENSFEFISKYLPGKLRVRGVFGRDGIILTIYGVLAIVGTVATVLFGIYIWENEAKILLHDVMAGRDLLAAVLLSILTLAAGTALVLGLGARALLFAIAQIKRARVHP